MKCWYSFVITVVCGETIVLNNDGVIQLPLQRGVSRQPRRRGMLADHQQVSTLYQGYGTHYVDLWVGTPTPERQTVIVDTGSQLIAFPCSGCKDCGDSYHTDGYYAYENSDTFHKFSCNECVMGHCSGSECHLGLSYQEGSSWSAFEASDIAYCGGMHDEPETKEDGLEFEDGEDIHHASAFSFELSFGCQTSLTGLFKTQLADGILGMSNEGGAFWKQMYKEQAIKKQLFSLCFSRQDIVEARGTLAGAITLGGIDHALSPYPMVYAKNIRGNGFYTVHLRRILLWNEVGRGIRPYNEIKDQEIVDLKLDESVLNSGGVIVDSGTTDSYFNHQIKQAFNSAWKQLTGNDYDNKELSLTVDELNSMPTILFQFQKADVNHQIGDDPNEIPGLVGGFDPENPYDVLVAMPPSHYMEYDSDQDKYIPRFYLDEYGGSVLGANFMMGHDIAFDIDNGLLGFAESDCDYLGILNPTDKKFESVDPTPQTPFAHEESDLCDDRCEILIGLSVFVVISLMTVVNKIRRWRRRYASVEEFIPNIELSSQHGNEDDIDERFSIDDDEHNDGFLDPRRIV